LLGYVAAGKTLLGKWPLESPIKKWVNKGNIYRVIHKSLRDF
jgi:hypothetical protein